MEGAWATRATRAVAIRRDGSGGLCFPGCRPRAWPLAEHGEGAGAHGDLYNPVAGPVKLAVRFERGWLGATT